MMVSMKVLSLASASVLALGVGSASAATQLSDFSGFALTGTYVEWANGTFTDNGTDWTVQATDFGGGFHVLAAPVDATGETSLQVDLDINPGNVADKFNIVLIDGDGTERVYRFDNLVNGPGQTLNVDVSNFLQDNAVGAVPGLDLSNLTVFHLQGTFENSPSLAQDLTFDNLSLVPEPASLMLLGLGGLAMIRRKH